ncbi:MAG: peptide chain release factor N(5)-glutamine methyltransferase [bacterium]|nr:peptide chain release factor N(5)-glutamine methyltransferase [bacterium]
MKSNMEKEIGWLLQEKYGGKMTGAAKKDIERLKAGEPLDHIIGYVEFLDCKILASKDALIPRVETEYWVGEAIREIKGKGGKVKVLDMFAGSGCIGISIVRHFDRLSAGRFKNVHVVFADSEKPALKQIEKNCTLNKIPKSAYQMIQSDIFLNIRGKYDYIFANPPYIPTVRKFKIQTSVLKYEPHTALFGGENGLLYIRKFLAEAKNFLNKKGHIYMEFDSPQKKQIEALLKKYGYASWEFHKDQYSKWRWLVVNN